MHLSRFCTCVVLGFLYRCSQRVNFPTFRICSTRLSSNMSHITSFSKHLDLVAQSATELQGLISAGDLTSTQLVEACLAQIERHDQQGMNLHAMIAVSPKSKLLDMAKRLDTERQSNNLRGPFHGIPILLKVYSKPRSLRSSSLLITRAGYLQY